MVEFLVLSDQALLHLGDWKAQNLHQKRKEIYSVSLSLDV